MIISPMRFVTFSLPKNSFILIIKLIFILFFLHKTIDEILDRPVSSRVGFRGKRAVQDGEPIESKTQPQW